MIKNMFFILFCAELLSAQKLPSPTWEDVNYAGDNYTYHLMDIYLPEDNKKQHPVVLTIYGSAWKSNNSKASNYIKETLIQPLLKSGFAVVSINHRSSADALFPAQIHDVKAVIRYLRSHAKTYALNTHFIGITGSSSGGHLAAMAGTSSYVPAMEGKVGNELTHDSHVDAVVDWFGPTDFLIMDQCGSKLVHDAPESPESLLVGGAIQDLTPKVLKANPLLYITQKTPPFLILHGRQDELVPYCQSEVLHKALLSNKISSELVLIEQGKHGPNVLTSKYTETMCQFFKNQFSRK